MKLNLLLVPLVSAGFALAAHAGTVGKATELVQPPAEAAPLGVTLTVGYDTDYIFRGVEFAKNLVSGSIDYVLPIDQTFSLDLNAWYGASANAEAAPFAGGDSYGELDLSPTLLAKLGNSGVTLGLKYTWYHYMMNAHHFVEDVNELGGTIAYSAFANTPYQLDLTAGAYHDWTADGWYFEYAVSHTFVITSWLSLQPGVLISHASHYYGVDGGNHFKPWLAAPIKLTKTATLTPYIAGNLPYGSLDDNGEKSRVYGGVALSVTF